MKLAITRTICVLLLITGLVSQPLFLAEDRVSGQIEADSVLTTSPKNPIWTRIGPDYPPGRSDGGMVFDLQNQ
jgi:hypothetical protein